MVGVDLRLFLTFCLHSFVLNSGIYQENNNNHNTVESLLTDTPNKGHCIKYLSVMDKTKSPNFNLPINIIQLESLAKFCQAGLTQPGYPLLQGRHC